MTTIDAINTLPFELANIIYSYVGTHPVAELINDYMEEQDKGEFCVECSVYVSEYINNIETTCKDYWNGKCEYCYAEELGHEVYTCDECCEKTFEYGRFNNTENGLFCSACMMNKDEDGNEIEEDE
jgi:hypothetical protein